MGIVFGSIGVEQPTYDVLDTLPEYEVRHFQQELVKAEVSFANTAQQTYL